VIVMQVKLAGDAFLRATIAAREAGAPAVVFSVGPETGEHAVTVTDTAAQVLLLMMQLRGRGS
jgi:hypothetical protein